MTKPSSDLFAQRPIRSDFGRRREPVINLRRLFFLLSLVGLAVLIGVGVNFLQREPAPSGEVPTIKAEGPVKQRPDQPGGLDVPHQDVTVFQQIEKGGEPVKGGVEHLLPAPATPQPVPTAAPPQVQVVEASASAIAEKDEPPSPITASEPPEPVSAAAAAVEDSPIHTTTEKLIENAKPVVEEKKPEPVKKAPVKKAEAAPASAKAEQKEKSEPLVSAKAVAEMVKKPEAKAQAPKQEPSVEGRLPKELFTTGEVPVAAKKTAAPKEAPLEAKGKTAQVQLASLASQAEAQKEAARLHSRFAGVLGSASLKVVRAEIPGKGTYYRVLSAPVSLAKAKAICADLSKKKASCLLVK